MSGHNIFLQQIIQPSEDYDKWQKCVSVSSTYFILLKLVQQGNHKLWYVIQVTIT